jgi:hypothetical protein
MAGKTRAVLSGARSFPGLQIVQSDAGLLFDPLLDYAQ